MNPLKRVSKTGQTVKNKRKNTTGIAARIIALLHNRSEKAERHDSAQAQNHLTVCNRSRPAASRSAASHRSRACDAGTATELRPSC